MAELARGTVFDRPWGRTLAALGLRGLTGQLALVADGRTYEIAFSNGTVSGASSPIASDAAVRVALTGGLVSTTQVAELARKQAAAPDRDEVDLIAEHLRLGFDQAMRLRRRTIAQRAARTFSVEKGDFVVTDQITLPVVAGSELDIRTIIYLGAKQNLSESRLATELGLFGTWFRLKPEAFEDLPQFGFGEAERPIIEHLMNGASLGDLEAIADIDVRAVRAAVYALCATNACNVEQTRGQGATKPPMTPPAGTRRAQTEPPVAPPAKASGTTPPRTKAPSQQPLVAYRPGVRQTGKTQPPPVQKAAHTMAPVNVTPRASVTTAPATARTTTTSTPTTGTPITARTTTPTSGPATARTATTQRTITPTSIPRTSTPTTVPATSRTTTRAATSDGVRTGTASTPPASHPALERPSSSRPGFERAATSQSGLRTGSSSQSGIARAGSGTKNPPTRTLPGADEVKQLIDERVGRLEQGADHYRLIGVAATASGDEIRKAYFDLARQLHPDRLAALGITDESHVAHKLFAQLNTAFSTLSDPKRRTEYDALLGRGGEAAQRDEQAKAEAMANRIVQAEEAFKRGEMALRRDDYPSAIVELQKAVELNEEPDFLATLAWARFCATPDKQTVARETRTALEKAIQKSPRAINPRFLLGRVERILGRDKEALDLFKDVLFDKPHHAEAQSEVRAIEARLATKPSGGGGLFGRKR